MPFHWYLKIRSRFYSLRLHNVFSVYHYTSSLMFLNFSAFPFSMLLFLNNLLIRCPWCDIPPFPCFTTGTQLIIISQHATPLPISSPLFPRTKNERGASCPLFIIFPTVHCLLSSIWRCHHLLFWHIRFPSYSWSERCSKILGPSVVSFLWCWQ